MANKVYADGRGIGIPQRFIDLGDGTYAQMVMACQVDTEGTEISSFTTVNCTIASGQSISSEIDLGSRAIILGIIMPNVWTTASLTFQAGETGDLKNLYDETGTEVTVSADASRVIRFKNITPWTGVRYLKVRSGTSSTPVTQTADRTLKLIVGRV